jgi:ABC-2 type transport system ATP-binding protein
MNSINLKGSCLEEIIRTENLTKYYGNIKGIENVNFSVKKGEIFGFLGPNGAGKTTTIRTLLGFLKPTSGNAYIFGLNIKEDGKDIKQNIGYIPGDLVPEIQIFLPF